jgi:2-phosphoglycerate kinase
MRVPSRGSSSRGEPPKSDASSEDARKVEAAGEGAEVAGSKAPARSERLWVADAGKRRPFMRGIVIHSLMARGVSFEHASATANRVRQRLRPQGVVSKSEILAEIRKILGDAPFQGDHHLPPPLDIEIQGRGRTRPFSKGVLSQSLLAAAVDPNDAFDVAREIEREIAQRGARELDREALRSLTYQTLARTQGPEAAERYLLWRRRGEPKRPIILLLGGAAGVGKTSLALEVAHRLGIGRVLSSDSVRQIMRLTLSPELAPALHGSSYDAWKLLPPEGLGDDPVIDGFRAQTSLVSVGVRASIDRAVSENADTVIDGVSIVPGAIDPTAYEGLADIVFLVVATLDPETYAARISDRAEDQSHRPAHHYLENLDAILRIQDYFLEAAERHHVPIVDNDSFDRAVLFIIRHVTETLRKRWARDAEEPL